MASITIRKRTDDNDSEASDPPNIDPDEDGDTPDAWEAFGHA